jgi:quercetin dioxygenase-like cupin family protein
MRVNARKEQIMNEVSIVAPDDGEVIELGPATVRILEDGGTTSHRLGIGEITLAPHGDGPPRHRHAEHDEGFCVVSGTARFTVGQTVHDAPPPGTLVMVPPVSRTPSPTPATSPS